MLKLAPGTKIYLACPYSHDDSLVKKARFNRINRVAAILMKQGFIVFSPISHSHPIALTNDLPGDFAYWQKWNRSFLEWCEVFVIAKLKGWEDSIGINGEREIVQELKKPIIEIDPYLPPYNIR